MKRRRKLTGFSFMVLFLPIFTTITRRVPDIVVYAKCLLYALWRQLDYTGAIDGSTKTTRKILLLFLSGHKRQQSVVRYQWQTIPGSKRRKIGRPEDIQNRWPFSIIRARKFKLKNAYDFKQSCQLSKSWQRFIEPCTIRHHPE